MRRSGRVAEPGAERTHQRGGVQVLPGGQGPGDAAVGPDQQRVDVHPVRAHLLSGIRLVWADSGYAGKLVGWAAKLRRTVQIVAKLCRADHFRGAAPQVGGRAHLFLDQPIPTHVRDYEPRPEHHAAMAQWAMTIITTRRLARHQHT
jgi:hypothetical protein